MGAMQRRKGRAFEQQIARLLRSAFPGAEVRRSSQADRAVNSDVVVTGSPMLERLWLELQDARQPTPAYKLAQAERDCERAWNPKRDPPWAKRWPIVIWHRFAERSHQVTTRLWVVIELIRDPLPPRGGDAIITMDLGAFISLLMTARTNEPRS